MPTNLQLKKGAVHANYEIGMLLDTAQVLSLEDQNADVTIRRALLESWLLHIRGVIEFFHPGPKADPDTVRAEWYVASIANWEKALPKLNKRERARRKALHKHLAHISYLRDARRTRWSSNDHRIVTRRLELLDRHLATKYRQTFTELVRLRATALQAHAAGSRFRSKER
jgi:hypothetical protein